MEKQITLSDRLRTVRSWGIWGVCGVVLIDLLVTAYAGPCGPKPDWFDWFYLVLSGLLLAQQFVIVGITTRTRGQDTFEWRWDLMWVFMFGLSFVGHLNSIRFPYVFPGCS